MKHTENWIWLPEKEYPNEQGSVYSGHFKSSVSNYTVAEFAKKYKLDKKVIKAQLRFSGDAVFQLFCNERIIATGPACVGGDFIGNETVRDNFYAFEETVFPDSRELDFFARVQLSPYHICEYSKGHGGFMLSAILTLEDGTQETVCTNESWLVRKNGAYTAPKAFDARIKPSEFINAECIPDIWRAVTAPIPIRYEEEISPENSEFSLSPFQEKEGVLELDMIWGGFVQVKAETDAARPNRERLPRN